MSNRTLHRYWIEFDIEMDHPRSVGGLLIGCGVTGYDYDDAIKLICDQIFLGDPLPPIRNVVTDVDISILDSAHVLPNMGVSIARGIWFPNVNA